MRVFALGGAGDMGAYALRFVADDPAVSEIVVADRNTEAAKDVASGLAKAAAAHADASDEDALVAQLVGFDLVLNTAGPFDRFGTTPLRAAIRANVPFYCDICDDWQPTADMLELDAGAKAAGVTALIGMGASPGISNLLARHAFDQLDEVDEIWTCWVSAGNEGDGSRDARSASARRREEGSSLAALEHMLAGACGDIPTFRDGRLVRVPSFRTGETVDFLSGGSYEVFHIGHPEPITLGRFLRGIRTVANMGALYPPPLNDLVRLQARRIEAGEIDPHQGAVDFMAEIMRAPTRWLAAPDGTARGGLCVVAHGRKRGRPMRYTCAPAGFPPGGMAGATGIPLAIGARMLVEAGPRPGVYAPEACIDPEVFFRRFAEHYRHRFLPDDSDAFVIERVEELDDGQR